MIETYETGRSTLREARYSGSWTPGTGLSR